MLFCYEKKTVQDLGKALASMRQYYIQEINAYGDKLKQQNNEWSGLLSAHAVAVADIHKEGFDLARYMAQSFDDYKQTLITAVKTYYDIDLSNVINVIHELQTESYTIILSHTTAFCVDKNFFVLS